MRSSAVGTTRVKRFWGQTLEVSSPPHIPGRSPTLEFPLIHVSARNRSRLGLHLWLDEVVAVENQSDGGGSKSEIDCTQSSNHWWCPSLLAAGPTMWHPRQGVGDDMGAHIPQ
jgi:hypothetical protein